MIDKKVVLITGANGGIGSCLCKHFNSQGYYVIATDIHEEPRSLADRYIKTDLANIEEIKFLSTSICENEQRLDVLVNNAAYQSCDSIVDTSPEEWDKVFAINVRAPFMLLKCLFTFLKENKGSVVNVVSVHAYASSPDISAYAASKSALQGFTRNAAIEFAKDKVRVNAVAPAAIDTEMLRDGLSRSHAEGNSIDEKVNTLGTKHLLERVGSPDEIAKAVYFLADSEQSSFMTGQTLVCDGGALIKLSTE